jgi:16S rRNA processing protein RimM
VVLAAVAGAHGLKGEVRLKLFTGDLSPYTHLYAGERRLTVAAVRGDIARFAEVTDRTAAEGLRGTVLTVPRSALPPLEDGEYYHSDLLDLAVVDTAGAELGRVVAIDNYGAGDVIEIERPDARRFMVPMREEAVPEWNAERLVVDPAFVA